MSPERQTVVIKSDSRNQVIGTFIDPGTLTEKELMEITRGQIFAGKSREIIIKYEDPITQENLITHILTEELENMRLAPPEQRGLFIKRIAQFARYADELIIREPILDNSALKDNLKPSVFPSHTSLKNDPLFLPAPSRPNLPRAVEELIANNPSLSGIDGITTRSIRRNAFEEFVNTKMELNFD